MSKPLCMYVYVFVCAFYELYIFICYVLDICSQVSKLIQSKIIHQYIYISSSSSCRAGSTDIPDPPYRSSPQAGL